MKNSYKRKNIKVIALIVEIVLLTTIIICSSIIPQMSESPFIYIFVVVVAILIFALVLTLSLIKHQSMRDIRETFKESNLPLYTDQQTMLLHDIVDEAKEWEKK